MSIDYTIVPARLEDADALADLRVAAMRESLEALGRFDPQRARDRLLSRYSPADTRKVLMDGALVAFYTCTRQAQQLYVDHFYVAPEYQNRGLGSALLERVKAEAASAALPLRLNALRGSRSNAFYERHGFRLTHEDEWDQHYELCAR